MKMGAAGTAALCCVMMTLCVAAPARAADPFFGVFTTNFNAPAAQANHDMDAQAATGVGFLREHVYWDEIETAPGTFDFTRLDLLVSRAAARGLTLLPILTSTPQFYSTRPVGLQNDGWPPRDPSSIFRFAYELTHRYGVGGTYWGCLTPALLCLRPYRPVTAWQIWNEPDLPAWWRTGVSPAAYLGLLQYAYLGMKLGDPAAEVVLGGLSLNALLSGGFLDQLYDLGAAPFFDTLALHPYAVNVGTLISYLQRVRQIAAAHNDANVPLRVTEYGYATGGRSAWTTTAPCQAALIAATTRELFARRVQFALRSISLLQWQDRAGTPAPWPNFAGLVDSAGVPKPALAAFTDAVRNPLATTVPSVASVCEPEHVG